MRWPPALSTMTVWGTPCWLSSQAVSDAPWLRGRVSSTQTWTGKPSSWARKIGASAVPQSTQASQPALQWVRTLRRDLSFFSARIFRKIASPSRPIASLTATFLVAEPVGAGVGGGEPFFRGQLSHRRAHLFQGPAQVHRRGARGQEHGAGPLEHRVPGVALQGEADAVGRRGSDERGAPHRHVADRLGAVVHRGESQRFEGVRKQPLVDHRRPRPARARWCATACPGSSFQSRQFVPDLHAQR